MFIDEKPSSFTDTSIRTFEDLDIPERPLDTSAIQYIRHYRRADFHEHSGDETVKQMIERMQQR